MRAVFLDSNSLGSDVDLTKLHAVCEELELYDGTASGEVSERVREKDIVIVNKVKIQESHLIENPNLKLIAVTATGVNNIDMDAAKDHGVEVRNVVHYGTPTIVQHVFSLILALSNNLMRYQQDVIEGQWNSSPTFCLMDHPIRELSGLTMGIIGFGELGFAVAKVAEAFGMQVKVGARPGADLITKHGYNYCSFEEVLAASDVLSLHCLLSSETQKMLNEETLSLMKKDALLINTARGGLIDEVALATALKQGNLGGAGIDVLSEEPPLNGNVLIDPAVPNLLVTPHCAWASRQARQRLLDMTADNIHSFYAQQHRQVAM